MDECLLPVAGAGEPSVSMRSAFGSCAKYASSLGKHLSLLESNLILISG